MREGGLIKICCLLEEDLEETEAEIESDLSFDLAQSIRRDHLLVFIA